MSILIKGLKMPDYCDECPVEYDGMCRLCSYADTEYHKRRDDCPLVAFDTDDVAPIVRCSSCNKYRPFGNGYGVCGVFGHTMKDNDYCSYGESKESEDKSNE